MTASRTEKLAKRDLTPILDLAIATAFAAYDKDGDGRLNFPEWCAFAKDSIDVALLLDGVAHPSREGAPWDGLEVMR